MMKHRLTREKFYGPNSTFIDVQRGLYAHTVPNRPPKRVANIDVFDIELGEFWEDDNEFA